MIYWQLFWSFFQIGILSIGGGYAALPLIQHQVVDLHGWLTMTQFADITAIAEMTPGPIAINAATFVGTQTAGLAGAVIATMGCVFPSCVIVLILARVYYRHQRAAVIQGILGGLRPAVVAMIASAGLSLVILALYGSRSLPGGSHRRESSRGGDFCGGAGDFAQVEAQPHFGDGRCRCRRLAASVPLLRGSPDTVKDPLRKQKPLRFG